MGSFWKPDKTGWKFKVEAVVVERSSYRRLVQEVEVLGWLLVLLRRARGR